MDIDINKVDFSHWKDSTQQLIQTTEEDHLKDNGHDRFIEWLETHQCMDNVECKLCEELITEFL